MFEIPVNRTYNVFLLGNGTKLSLISQNIIQPQPAFKVAHDTQLFMSKTIAKTSDKTCQDITIAQKMDCIIDKIEEKLFSKGIACIPFFYSGVFPKLQSKFGQCEDDFPSTKDIHHVRNVFVSVKFNMYLLSNPQEVWSLMGRYALDGCPIMCQKVRYNIRVSQLGENAMNIEEKSEVSAVYASYESSKIEINEEYLLMGVTSIISATGGSLGLFLGFSCFGAIWNIFEMIESIIKYFIPSHSHRRKRKEKTASGKRYGM